MSKPGKMGHKKYVLVFSCALHLLFDYFWSFLLHTKKEKESQALTEVKIILDLRHDPKKYLIRV